MLEIDGLSISYCAITAVEELSLTVNEGELVALLGHNGAGKTSTVTAVCGLLPRGAMKGQIRLDGADLSRAAPEDRVRRGVALVPEGRRIFSALSVRDNLMLGATVRKDKAQVKRDLASVLERFPVLGRYLTTPAGRLSGGEQQQLALGRALLARPRLLLVDEPSLGLAPKIVAQVFDILRELQREGVTILLVEQNASTALELADRSYILRAGRVRLSGSRDDLRANTDLLDVYFGGAGSTPSAGTHIAAEG
jgi:branched-chain amino acid transport system ATP-binding protein